VKLRLFKGIYSSLTCISSYTISVITEYRAMDSGAGVKLITNGITKYFIILHPLTFLEVEDSTSPLHHK
jgi:hypothetical protein